MRARCPSLSIAFRSFSLTTFISEGVVPSYRMLVRPSRSVGSFEPCAWRMKVRRIPRTPPKRPASNTTLSRGEALARLGLNGSRRSARRPVVLGKDKRREIDLLREFEQALQRGGPRD